MLKQFAQKIEDLRRLIDDSRSASSVRFLLAISGGMDSMCMADLFLRSVGADSFAVAHCNFSLRGDESDGDEAMVREWAERNDVRLFVKCFDTVGYARENSISIEMAARDLRYGWFNELCREYNYEVLSVAHNANDNAETLMLNLLRGTGLNGLHGMSVVSVCPTVSSGTPPVLFRPLLDFTRKQIDGYVLAHRVPFRHDSSNFESDYKRNKIRNEVFPVFEKINPSFIRTLNREIGYFADAGSIVEDWCLSQVPYVVSAGHSSDLPHGCLAPESLVIDTVRLLSVSHWRYLLYHILEPYGFNAQILASVEDLLTSSRTISGKRFESSTHVLLTGRGTLTVVPCSCIASSSDSMTEEKSTVIPAEISADMIVVRGPGTYNYNGARFTVEVISWDASMSLKQPHGVMILDAEKIKFPFVCRRWRQGDWLIPLGMRGKKKVSDLFADLKYDTLSKDSAIIMVDTQTEGLAGQQHVAALLGIRPDERYKVTSITKQIVRITLI